MLLVLTFSSFPSWAANSFIMNRHTPTCDKYLDEKNRPTNMSDKELEYRSLRICDQRWGTDGWPPVWLGLEPRHPKKETTKCKELKDKYYEVMAGRDLLDNYECKPPEREGGLVMCKYFKANPPERAEEAAKILEKATELNCFFY